MLINYMSGDKSKNVTEINAIQTARDVSKAAAGMVRGVSPEHKFVGGLLDLWRHRSE